MEVSLKTKNNGNSCCGQEKQEVYLPGGDQGSAQARQLPKEIALINTLINNLAIKKQSPSLRDNCFGR